MTVTVNEQSVQVRIDDRARLLSAALAATGWPEDEQARKPHGTHAHARGTRRVLAEHKGHPAVQTLQLLLDKKAPLEALFTYIMSLTWPGLEGPQPSWMPPKWSQHLWDFYRRSGLEDWWAEEDFDWSEAASTSATVLDGINFQSFLANFIGPVQERFYFLPNICYPTDTEIGVRVGSDLYCVAPPRIAWGDNPPWPYDEDPAHVYRAALSEYSRLLILGYLGQHPHEVARIANQKLPINQQFREKYPTFNEQFVGLFIVGVVGVFLEREVNEREAKAYVLMRQRVEGLKVLPGMVSVLQRYLDGREAGRWTELVEYLPHFSKHLRVAKTITTL